VNQENDLILSKDSSMVETTLEGTGRAQIIKINWCACTVFHGR